MVLVPAADAAGLAEGSDAGHSCWRPDNQPVLTAINAERHSRLDAMNRHTGNLIAFCYDGEILTTVRPRRKG
jgi:hypothetical protein